MQPQQLLQVFLAKTNNCSLYFSTYFFSRALEAAKVDVMELPAQLHGVTMDNLNEDGKGNSLFSEVNDRRERVKSQLHVTRRSKRCSRAIMT